MKPYKLMCSIFGHTQDVKSLCITREDGGFASVSRDLATKIWSCNLSTYTESRSFTYHKKYVNAIALVYTLPAFPNGLILTGSNDKTVSIHDIQTSELVGLLQEHDGAVCNLYFDNMSGNNILYSGSFDSTAKVWNLNNFKAGAELKSSLTIKSHEQTIWSVLGIEKQRVLLTGSADKTIKHWQLNSTNTGSELICTYKGHTDCVRALALNNVNTNEFFSCSNDGSVIQWQITNPNPMRVFQITNSFLYSINMVYGEEAASDECLFVTSGEDRTLRIHSSLKGSSKSDTSGCVQSLALPCQTLWYTVCLPNGTIAVACSDGSIRLFTKHEKLMANASEQEEYERELSQFAIPVKSDEVMSQIDRTKLPGLEALTQQGAKDGQTLMVANGDEVEVHQWSGADKKWVKIGVAVGSSTGAGGSSGTRQKTSYLGQEYDFVFDIDMDDSGAKLKLPYNLSEDPYMAAQKFIHNHELSQMFLDEIAQFIITNTKGETITATAASCDPFTGTGAYTAGSAPAQQYNNGGSMVDPLTGGSAYYAGNRPAPAQAQSKPASSQSTYQAISNEYFPHSSFILFDQLNYEPIFKKLRELQAGLDGKHELIKSQSNMELIENLLTSYSKSATGAEFNDQIELLFEMISLWPIESVFPMLDLVRILSLNKNFATYITRTQSATNYENPQGQHSSNTYFNTLSKFLIDDRIVNTMLTVKIYCNLFNSLNDVKEPAVQKLLAYILHERNFLFHKLNTLLTSSNVNKSFQIAYTTLVLNYIVLMEKLQDNTEKFTAQTITGLHMELIQYLNNTQMNEAVLMMDQEAIFRILVSIGTLLTKTRSQKDTDYLKTIYRSLEVSGAMIEKIVTNPTAYAEKVKKSAVYILKMFE